MAPVPASLVVREESSIIEIHAQLPSVANFTYISSCIERESVCVRERESESVRACERERERDRWKKEGGKERNKGRKEGRRIRERGRPIRGCVQLVSRESEGRSARIPLAAKRG